MKNLPFIVMLIAWLACQFLIFEKDKQIKNYKEAIETHEEVNSIYKATVDEAYSGLLQCSDTIDMAKQVMVQFYIKGADDYRTCKEEFDNDACHRLQLGIKKLGEYND